MKFRAFALPALAAMFISLSNLFVQIPSAPLLASLFPTSTKATADAVQIPTTRKQVEVQLKSRQSLSALLVAQGIDPSDAADITDALSDRFNPRRFSAGQRFTLALVTNADGTDLEKLSFTPNARQRITVQKDDSGEYAASAAVRPTDTRMVVVDGKVSGSLAASAKRAGVPRSVAAQMTRWLAYDVDFQRDLQNGDRFAVMFQAEYDETGALIGAGAPQYIALDPLKSGAKTIQLYAYGKKMYHADGASVVRNLLKTPVDGARVTSGFGMRMHPLLGYSAMHKGIDFGAEEGTPVLAAGDGVIQKASPFAGYGNYILLRHNSTYSTAYGHLQRYARGIRPGTRVHQGQVIGYVGQTGLATGPHLHFEVKRGAIQVNPTKVASMGSDKLEGGEMKKFAASIRRAKMDYAAAISRRNIRLASNTAAAGQLAAR